MTADAFSALDWRDVGSVAGAIVAAALALVFMFRLTQGARHTEYQLGDDFGDARAVVESWSAGSGYVRVGGELWRAEGRAEFSPGDPVRVAGKRGMLLRVKRD